MMQTAKQNMGFKALVAANHKAGRLAEPVAQDPLKKMQQAGMRLTVAEIEQAQQLAESEHRYRANFLRAVYLRGLASYLAEHGSATPGQ